MQFSMIVLQMIQCQQSITEYAYTLSSLRVGWLSVNQRTSCVSWIIMYKKDYFLHGQKIHLISPASINIPQELAVDARRRDFCRSPCRSNPGCFCPSANQVFHNVSVQPVPGQAIAAIHGSTHPRNHSAEDFHKGPTNEKWCFLIQGMSEERLVGFEKDQHGPFYSTFSTCYPVLSEALIYSRRSIWYSSSTGEILTSGYYFRENEGETAQCEVADHLVALRANDPEFPVDMRRRNSSQMDA